MKTKQAAMEAARKKLGAAANEGVDFTCTNTGAGWTWTEIQAANEPAAKAKAKRAKGAPHTVSAPAKPKAPKTAAKAPRAPKFVDPDDAPPLGKKFFKNAEIRNGDKIIRPAAAPAAGTKGAAILTMLRGPGGASSKEMEQATGWKAASVRGYLGTLRSQGFSIESKKLGKGEPVVYKLHEAKTATAADVGDVV